MCWLRNCLLVLRITGYLPADGSSQFPIIVNLVKYGNDEKKKFANTSDNINTQALLSEQLNSRTFYY
jgi:hypothetical protein